LKIRYSTCSTAPIRSERSGCGGIRGGLTGLGGTTGTIISGALTDLASWRWIFYINLPIALFALFMVPRLVSESRMVGERQRLDVTGAITGTGSLVAIGSRRMLPMPLIGSATHKKRWKPVALITENELLEAELKRVE